MIGSFYSEKFRRLYLTIILVNTITVQSNAGNIIQQIRSNQRNDLISLNANFQRREKLIEILETKESLTIDSEELLTILNNIHNDRIINENSLNEHQVQYEMLCLRTACEVYRETAKHLPQLYIILRDSNMEFKIAIKCHSWLLCFSNEINKKYPNLSENLIDYQHEWKEYLYSTTKADFVNKSSLEKQQQLNIDPLNLVKHIADLSQSMNNDLFPIFEHLFEKINLLNEKSCSTKDEMLLGESLARSYLTHFRSIYFSQHHSTCSSLIDLFI
ncbi:unnamed protein product [Rotaria sp. Silwood1]|nr:unnamed protein product [Rotaria sp. Silwood1]CAF1670163.1 unnamed protein product [Rotaria sp. Silwood1]